MDGKRGEWNFKRLDVPLSDSAAASSSIERLDVSLRQWVSEKGQKISRDASFLINTNDRDMLIYTCGQDLVRNNTGPSKGDSIARDIQKNVSGADFGVSQFIGMFFGNERKARDFKPSVKHVLASDQSVRHASVHIHRFAPARSCPASHFGRESTYLPHIPIRWD